MTLIGEVRDYDGHSATCSSELLPDSPFVHDGHHARAIVLVEHMAQTVAALTSLRSRERGEPQRRGYLVGLRRLRLRTDRVSVGVPLLITATEAYDDGGELASFACQAVVEESSKLLAEGRLNVYRWVPQSDSEE